MNNKPTPVVNGYVFFGGAWMLIQSTLTNETSLN